MGRKPNWFNAVKKALRQDSKDSNSTCLKVGKTKRKWFMKKRRSDPSLSYLEAVLRSPPPEPSSSFPLDEGTQLPLTSSAGLNLSELEREQATNAYSVVAKEAAAAAQAAVEVARLTAAAHPAGKSKEELAAVKIQTALRGYLARRTLIALKGLARLKPSMQRQAVTHQTTSTLKAMQTLVRVQYQIHDRRLKTAECNLSRQKKLLEKHTKEMEASEMGEDWDDSTRTREHVKTRLQIRQEAAVRRERAMAYAFNHQQTWRKPANSSTNRMFLDPNNPHWGWSWLERWSAAKPSETAVAKPEKELNNGLKSSKLDAAASRGSAAKTTTEKKFQHTAKTSGLRQAHAAAPLSASTINPSKAVSLKSVNRTLESPTPKASTKAASSSRRSTTRGINDERDDVRSVESVESGKNRRRHGISGSSVRDDESLGSSPATPSYMAPTASTKAKKRLSYPSSPAKSRRSAFSEGDVDPS